MMQQLEREVIFLKPTPVFLSFLREALPTQSLPTLKALQKNTSAYTLPRHATDDELLDTIESHFLTMFTHEVNRRFGENAIEHIKASFLDFLCCFKFEIHSHIVVLASSIEAGQQVLRLKPRPALLESMRAAWYAEDDGDQVTLVKQVSLPHLKENATVLVKNFTSETEVEPFVKQYYKPIYKMEMMRVCESREHWPLMQSVEDFNRYFSVEMHTSLIHLSSNLSP